MQKPQILWRNQTPSRSSLKLGWKQLSRNARVALITFSLLYLGLSIYRSLEQQSASSLLLCIVSISSLTITILHTNGFPKDKLGSLMQVLKTENGTIWIGDYPLPDTVRKVVIGRIDIQGPAFLQLAWNQGHQWIFQLDELQQVRHFFRQHAPQIEIVNE
ncbi:hypothetical protein [Rheinheimera faecalis]